MIRSLFVFFVLISNLLAIPRFSLRQNDRCIDCHTNPTGGIIRNENGWYFGKNFISRIIPAESDFKFSPKINDNISIGLDYRSQYLYSQELNETDFQDMTGSLYMDIKLSQDIDVLSRYDFVNKIWEAYGIARILPNNSYIKVGTFQANFGLRIDDHTAYTRGGDFHLLFATGQKQGLIFNPFRLETGLELGINLGNFGLLTTSVGKSSQQRSFSSEPAYMSRIEIWQSVDKVNLLFGGSYASVKTPLNSKFYGSFLGIGIDRLVILAEYDFADDYVFNEVTSSALMIKTAYKIFAGVEAIIRYDRLDKNTRNNNDEFSHLIFGLEFYPFSFIELRPQYRINLESADVKNNAALLQFHIWY